MQTTDMKIRRAADRGHINMGWLDTHHTFSFGEYHDPKHMGFRSLRVINDDIVEPGQGFGMHPHRDMEILSVIIDGALEHKDSLGNGSVIRAGEFQRMTAGTGVRHSEFNPSDTERVRLLQIWILPAQTGLDPSYEQREIGQLPTPVSGLTRVADSLGIDAIKIHQDARVLFGSLKRGEAAQYELAEGRGLWVQVIDGRLHSHGEELSRGDGASVESAGALTMMAPEDARFLLFDLC